MQTNLKIEIASLSGLFDKELREKNIDPEKIRKNYCKVIPKHIELIPEEKVILFIEHPPNGALANKAKKVFFSDNKFFLITFERLDEETDFNNHTIGNYNFKFVKMEPLNVLEFLEKHDYLGKLFLRTFNPFDVVEALERNERMETKERNNAKEATSKEA